MTKKELIRKLLSDEDYLKRRCDLVYKTMVVIDSVDLRKPLKEALLKVEDLAAMFISENNRINEKNE